MNLLKSRTGPRTAWPIFSTLALIFYGYLAWQIWGNIELKRTGLEDVFRFLRGGVVGMILVGVSFALRERFVWFTALMLATALFCFWPLVFLIGYMLSP